MKFFKYFLCVFVAQLFVAGQVLAQVPDGIIVNPGPEAYATIKNGNFTGVANTGEKSVSVPLFTLAAEGHSTSVSLNSTLGSRQSSEVATYVGLGWSLSTGASLTRTIVGFPDESIYGHLNNPTLAAEYVASATYNTPPYPNNHTSYRDNVDAGPDIFRYSVEGKSGMFRFNRDGSVEFQPVNNVKVEYNSNFTEFVLVGPSGKRYQFGDVDQVNNPSTDISNTGAFLTGPSAVFPYNGYAQWHLTRVSDANGYELLRATYKVSEYISEVVVNCDKYYQGYAPLDHPLYGCGGQGTGGSINNCRTTASQAGLLTCPTNPTNPQYTDALTGSKYTHLHNSVCVPLKIENALTGRSIDFTYSSGRTDVLQVSPDPNRLPVRLSEVSFDNGFKTVKKTLSHKYAVSADPGAANNFYESKLLLTGVESLDAGNVSLGETVVRYNAPLVGTVYQTTSRLSAQHDHWGFLNELTASYHQAQLRMPKGKHYYYDYNNANFRSHLGFLDGVDRAPSLAGSKHLTIAGIDYPQGVSTDVEYEQHTSENYAPDLPSDLTGLTPVGQANACSFVEVPSDGSTPQRQDCSWCDTNYTTDPASDSYQIIVQPGVVYAIEVVLSHFDHSGPGASNFRCDGDPCSSTLSLPRDLSALEGTVSISGPNSTSQFDELLNTQAPTPPPGCGANGAHDLIRRVYYLHDFYPESLTQVLLPYTVWASARHGTMEVKIFEVPFSFGSRAEDVAVGGVRVKKIDVTDRVNGKKLVHHYDYNDVGTNAATTSGRLLRTPSYGLSPAPLWSTPTTTPANQYDCLIRSLDIRPKNPLNNMQGTHIEYTAIRETINDGSAGSVQARYHEPEVDVIGKPSANSFQFYFGMRFDPWHGAKDQDLVFDASGNVVASTSYSYQLSTGRRSSRTLAQDAFLNAPYQFNCESPFTGNGYSQVILKNELIREAPTTYALQMTTLDREVRGTSSRSVSEYSGFPNYDLQTAVEFGAFDGAFVGQVKRTETDYLPLDPSDAHARDKNFILASATREYIKSGGTTSLVGGTETAYERYTSAGALGGNVYRPEKRYQLSNVAGTKRLTQHVKTYTPFGAPKTVARWDNSSDDVYLYNLDRLQSYQYLNHRVTALHEGNSLLLRQRTDEGGVVTSYTYDNALRLKTVSELGGNRTTTYTYLPFGQTTVGQVPYVDVRVQTNAVGTSEAVDQTTRTYYDGFGNQEQQIRAGQRFGGGSLIDYFTFDAFNRAYQTFEVQSSSSSSLAHRTRPGGLDWLSQTSYLPDPTGTVQQVEKPQYGTIAMAYRTSNGVDEPAPGTASVTITTDEEGYSTINVVDVHGRPSRSYTSSVYGKSLQHEYDGFGRLSNLYRAYPSTSPAQTITHGYDAYNNLISRTIPEEGTTRWKYDDRNRLLASQTPYEAGFSVSTLNKYDDYDAVLYSSYANGQPSGLTASSSINKHRQRYTYRRGLQQPGFGQVDYYYEYYDFSTSRYLRKRTTYDSYSRPVQVALYNRLTPNFVGGSDYGTETFAFDYGDNLIAKSLVYRSRTETEAYNYDPQGYLQDATYGASDISTPAQVNYAYDGNQLVTQKELSVGSSVWQTIAYTYDDQLNLVKINDPCLASLVGEPCSGGIFENFGLPEGLPFNSEMLGVAHEASFEGELRYEEDAQLLMLSVALSTSAVLDEKPFDVRLDTVLNLEELLRGSEKPFNKDEKHGEIRLRDTVLQFELAYTAQELGLLVHRIQDAATDLGGDVEVLNRALSGVTAPLAEDFEDYHRLLIAGAASAAGPETLGKGGGKEPIAMRSTTTNNDVLFNQQLFRTSSHPHFAAPGRGDGLLSYTRSQIACSDAFDFAYTYDPDHDQALSYSHYARREQVGSGACISYTYADLDDYMSYYVYEKPSNPSESLGRFNRFGRYGDHPGYAPGSLIDRIYLYYYDSARPGRATRAGEYYAHRNLGYTSGYLFSTSANLTYGTGGMLTQASSGDQQLTYGRKLAKPSSFTVMGQSTTNFHFEDGTAAGYQTPSGDKHHFLGATERKNSVPHRMRMPEGYYDYPLGKWVFELKDYLGTPRVTFTDINGDGVIRAADDILEQQTLYPFGQYAFGATNSSVAGYTGDDVDFTGHQLRGGQINRLHALHDMQARYFVSGLAMFGGVDPLASSFAGSMPYHYTHNNPINLVDPTGMSAIHNSGSIASTRLRENRAAQVQGESEEAAQRLAEQVGTTVDVYAVNFAERSNMTTPEIVSSMAGAAWILQKSIDANFSFHFLNGQDLPGSGVSQYLSESDRSLFIGYTNNRFNNQGSSDINTSNGKISAWGYQNGVPYAASGVNTSLTLNYPSNLKGYRLSHTVAHEMSHQLDAMSMMREQGSLKNYPHDGHYNGTPNLLMKASLIPSGDIRDTQYELLLPSVKSRIQRYLND